MNVLVLYESRNGHTRDAANALAQAARDQKHTVTVKSIIEVRKADVENAQALFIGTWVHGLILFGVRPAGAELWVPNLPALEGKPVGNLPSPARYSSSELSLDLTRLRFDLHMPVEELRQYTQKLLPRENR